jgi:polyisoprenoid-binding protein YceI
MTLSAGDYELGPDNARLIVATGRQGVAARAGHDLVLEVMQWEATLKVAAHAAACSLVLTVDAASLEVVGASGGMKPLTDKDKADIRATIDKQVLKRQAIEFRSIAISRSDAGLTVKGLLGLRGEERPVSFAISSDGAMITGGLRIDQRDWGIKPFSALFGALRVDAYVTVEVQSTAALLSSAAATEWRQLPRRTYAKPRGRPSSPRQQTAVQPRTRWSLATACSSKATSTQLRPPTSEPRLRGACTQASGSQRSWRIIARISTAPRPRGDALTKPAASTARAILAAC